MRNENEDSSGSLGLANVSNMKNQDKHMTASEGTALFKIVVISFEEINDYWTLKIKSRHVNNFSHDVNDKQ